MKIPTANFTASICATSTLFIVAIVLACVVAVGAFIYGVIRRLSRMSWAGLQIPVIFGLTMLLRFVPAAMGSSLRFSITVGGFFAITVCVLGLGALIRRAIRKREDARTDKPKAAALAFDRLFGGIVALFDWLLLAVILSGVVLSVVWAAGAEKVLPVVYESALWTKFLKIFAYDLFYVSFLVLVIKGGYRLGMIKGIWVTLAFALTAVAAFGAVYLTIRWSFLSGIAVKIGAAIKLNRIIADLIGYLITSAICFLVFFIVIILLTVVGNLIVKGLTRSPVFNAIDGCVSSVLFFAVTVVVSMGVGVGISYLETGASALGEYGETFAKIGVHIREILTSSFFRGVIYECNPLLLLLA